jgi:hypothetical protein
MLRTAYDSEGRKHYVEEPLLLRPQGDQPLEDERRWSGNLASESIIDWHGKICSGSDIKRWRRSVGLWQKDSAVLLGVALSTMNRAERSSSPSPGIIYGVELLRKQIIQGEFDLDAFRKSRDSTLPRKKGQTGPGA